MCLQHSPEQPLRRAQARVVIELEIAQRQQVLTRIVVLVLVFGLDTAKTLLELVHVTRVGAQRLAGCRVSVELEPVTESAEQRELEYPQRAGDALCSGELREAATIAGKDVGVRIATGGEAQQQLVDVKAGEQALAFERVA